MSLICSPKNLTLFFLFFLNIIPFSDGDRQTKEYTIKLLQKCMTASSACCKYVRSTLARNNLELTSETSDSGLERIYSFNVIRTDGVCKDEFPNKSGQFYGAKPKDTKDRPSKSLKVKPKPMKMKAKNDQQLKGKGQPMKVKKGAN